MKCCTSVHSMIFMGGFHINRTSSHGKNLKRYQWKIVISLFQLISCTRHQDQMVFIQEFKRTSQQKTHTIHTQTHQTANSALLPNTQFRNGGREKQCECLRGPVQAGVPGNPRPAAHQFGQMGRNCSNQKI